MALLKWDKTYAVGIKIVDDQHAGLFDSLNELHSAMLKGDVNAVISPMLQDLLAYTRTHFSAEELMLAKAKYPDLAEHQAKHRKFAAQIAEYAERHKRGETALSVHLIDFLRKWLTDHILREDRAYSSWLAQSGMRF